MNPSIPKPGNPFLHYVVKDLSELLESIVSLVQSSRIARLAMATAARRRLSAEDAQELAELGLSLDKYIELLELEDPLAIIALLNLQPAPSPEQAASKEEAAQENNDIQRIPAPAPTLPAKEEAAAPIQSRQVDATQTRAYHLALAELDSEMERGWFSIAQVLKRAKARGIKRTSMYAFNYAIRKAKRLQYIVVSGHQKFRLFCLTDTGRKELRKLLSQTKQIDWVDSQPAKSKQEGVQ